MSPAFTRVLQAARPDFNQRFAEARRAFPELTPARFSAMLTAAADPVVAAVDVLAPDRTGAVVDVLFDAALTLVGERLAGPEARHDQVEAVWTQVLPRVAPLVAAEPLRVIAALSNAACHLAGAVDARPGEWMAAMEQLAPRCTSVAELLALGQVLAWRAGLAHFRAGALGAAERLPAALALVSVGAPSSADWPTVRERLARDPWFEPANVAAELPAKKRGSGATDARMRIVRRAGAFRGFGGLFAVPPVVHAVAGQLVASSAGEHWLLTADACGATFHREATLAPAPDSLASGLPAGWRLDGFAIHRSDRDGLHLPELHLITSAAVSGDGTTLALTGATTHAVLLAALT